MPALIPLFPLDVVLFPEAPLPLHIFEERYKEMIGECLAERTPFGVVRAGPEGVSAVGCMAEIVSVLNRYEDGRLDILCRGEQRFGVRRIHRARSFFEADAEFFEDDGPEATRAERERAVALHFELQQLAGARETLPLALDEPVSFRLAASTPLALDLGQTLLEMRSDEGRTRKLIELYETVLPRLRRAAAGSRASGTNGRVM